MYLLARGRHGRAGARSRSPRPFFLSLLAALAVTAGFLALAGAPGSSAQVTAAQAAGQAAVVPDVVDNAAAGMAQAALAQAETAVQGASEAAAAARLIYTVRPGDSLSALAQARCGAARDWTGIYAASRAMGWTARDPGSLAPGQHLFLSCTYVPSMLSRAVTQARVLTSVNVSSSSQDASSADYAVTGQAQATYRGSGSMQGSGTYSFAGLEALWISAGGPSWAAFHAAEIAECESGGRVDAYNPSGATGLWQILGSVVPGSLDSPYVNALNAVAKFRASGDTFAQWVCR